MIECLEVHEFLGTGLYLISNSWTVDCYAKGCSLL